MPIDYTNYFTCRGCGKLLPFGTKKCNSCGYDYTNVEKSEKELKYSYLYVIVCVAWFLISCGFMEYEPLKSFVSDLGKIVFGILPVIAYLIWRDKHIIKILSQERWKIAEYDRISQERENEHEYISQEDMWDNAVIERDWLKKLLDD